MTDLLLTRHLDIIKKYCDTLILLRNHMHNLRLNKNKTDPLYYSISNKYTTSPEIHYLNSYYAELYPAIEDYARTISSMIENVSLTTFDKDVFKLALTDLELNIRTTSFYFMDVMRAP